MTTTASWGPADEPLVGVVVARQDRGGPLVKATVEQLADFTEAWLENRDLSPHTRDAYRRDVHVWIAWCTVRELEPLTVKFTHINKFARWLETPMDDEDEQPYVKRPAALASVARRLSAISSWYDYLLRLGLVPANPAAGADRPTVDRNYSDTTAFTDAEATAMYEAAREDPVLGDGCGPALMRCLVQLGARVSEACEALLADRGYEAGHTTIRLRMKGDKRRKRAMPPDLLHELDLYLRKRAAEAGVSVDQLTGYVFLRPDGRPLDRYTVARFVRRVAQAAGLPDANRISPHSARHAFAQISLAEGSTLEDRQDAMGHADPRTTRRYDKRRKNLDRDPSYRVAAATAQRSDQR